MSSPLASPGEMLLPGFSVGTPGYSVLSPQTPRETPASPHLSSGIFLAASSVCVAMFWGVPGAPLFSSVPVHKPFVCPL